MTHPHPKRNFVPRAVLMKSSLKTLNTVGQNSSRATISVNTAKPINIAYPRPIVNCAMPALNVFNRAHSHVRRPFNKFTTYKNSNFNERVNTIRGNVTTVRPKAVVSDNKGNNTNVVKASACWVWRPNQNDTMSPDTIVHQCYVDAQGRSKYMTGNMSYLFDYEEINGGYVAFGGDPKGGKITGKDDYSRFSWVFFLATKDETSGILKAFITGIENQINHRVKIIRCDNGTEFKNKEMNQFCEMKGIKREFSVARTPQQNGVAERKNRTLIEAARTMLADSKLPTTFWAEAVNTACYVQNRVLVIKPHNKTPYELFHGRTPSLSFMRPFGCPVTILNTLDHLGKFDGKADEGFFVGYSVNSKAFREAYTDSDYAGASLDKKSTTGGCQFLGRRLISWQCKKQIVVANSTTEAEYVAASNCFKNPVFHSKTKHIKIRHHFIRDYNEKKLIQMIKIHTDQNVADLLAKAFDVSRFQYRIASIGMLNL
ncbi:ribonuclease H-like domain-containing protein [Tanacetum coccineum]